ncbi:PBAN-type neuropeptides-like [Venturia canescens]|uniref:PBAN-type neuropeptides-like n=1 Tax=Venturia canescens TaxID=32260 RepID=UPI001C9C7047|nr:PBAN-type neuropeptides-like [Venturia canescens]
MVSIRIYKKSNSSTTSSGAIFLVSFLFTLLVGRASGEYGSNVRENVVSRSVDGNANGLCTGANCAERGSSVTGAMWFGPRLGRRRRSDEKTETFDEDQINTIADVLQSAPWTLVSIEGDKRRANQYTPRLGRESSEDLLQKLLMGDNGRLGRLFEGDDLMEERQVPPPPPPPPFAPRLGRRLTLPPPTPRLGRRLRALLQKL